MLNLVCFLWFFKSQDSSLLDICLLIYALKYRNIYIRQMSIIIMPKKGFDKEKIRKIKEVLRKNPRGLWVREIARKTGLDKSTVSIYLSKYIKDKVEVISISGLVKIFKLKR